MPDLRRLEPSLLVLLGGAALLIPACTSLLGTFELGSTGGGGAGSSVSSVSSVSSSGSSGGGGGGGGGGGDMTTGGGGGDPGSGTPTSASVLVPSGANDFARANSTSARLGIVAVGGAFSGQVHVATFDVACAKAASCGLVTRFDLSGHPNPQPPWAISLAGKGATDTAEVHGVAVDSQGSIFVVGSYSGSLSIDNGSPLPTFQDTVQHAFVAKLSNKGALQWAYVSATATPSVIASVAVDPTDNVMFAGDFTTAFTVSTCPTNIVMGGTGSFVTRLDGVMGACLSSTGLFGADVSVKAIASDFGGNPLVTGSHMAAMGLVGGVSLPKSASAGGDLFVLELDTTKQSKPLWLRDIKATLGAAGASVAAVQDAKGQFGVMVTGKLDGAAFAGTPCAVASTPGTSSVVARLDNVKGDCVWSKSFAGESAGVAVDGKGDLTLTGSFDGMTQLDPTQVLNAGPGKATFVVKLGSIAGGHRWSRAFSVQNAGDAIVATSVASDEGSGQWFVVGKLDGTTDFGVGPPLTAAKGGFLLRLGN